MKKPLLILFSLTLFSSCNDKNEREQILKNLYVKQKQHNDVKTSLENAQIYLTEMYGDLEVASDNINRAKQFHFLRLSDEREQQIKAAVEHKIEIEREIDSLKSKITSLKDSLTNTRTRITQLENFLIN